MKGLVIFYRKLPEVFTLTFLPAAKYFLITFICIAFIWMFNDYFEVESYDLGITNHIPNQPSH